MAVHMRRRAALTRRTLLKNAGASAALTAIGGIARPSLCFAPPALAAAMPQTTVRLLSDLPDIFSVEAPVELPEESDDAPAMMLYTSGTTSKPKGVVTTHNNIRAQVTSLIEAWEWTSADRTVLETAGREVAQLSSQTFFRDLEPASVPKPPPGGLGDRLDPETRARLERLRRGE